MQAQWITYWQRLLETQGLLKLVPLQGPVRRVGRGAGCRAVEAGSAAGRIAPQG